jgi:hypothetical protein
MDRQALERPFPQEVIKSRKGAHGQVSYVEAAHYIRRLNEAFDGKWSWSIVAREQLDGQVLVVGALEVGGMVKHAFGGSRVTTKAGGTDPISLADDFKAAGTDALKKACSLLGIGLDLYTASEPADEQAAEQQGPRRYPLRDVSRDPSEPARLTGKQLKAIYAIASAHGLSDTELKRQCKEAYGVMPEYLSKSDASQLIEKLSER